jgi:hypothetical protein
MRTLIAAALLFFACLAAEADTLPPQPTCTCTISFSGHNSPELAHQLKRATCRCSLADARGTAQSPIRVDVHDFPPDHSGAAIAAAIVALTLVTGSQAFYIAKLWRSTRQLANSAESTAQRQLRAYLTVSDIILEPQIEGEAPRVTVHIHNFGATPAYKLEIAVEAQIAGDERQLSVATNASRMLAHLPPRVEFAITRAAVEAPGLALADEFDTSRSVFVHGRIEYVDTFGEPHFTRFRLRGGADQSFLACREGNETDDVLLSRRPGI